jgi:methylmalonyl-CoA mutase
MSNITWKNLILKTLKTGTDEEKLAFYNETLIQHPEPGIEIQPFYTAEDLAELEYLKEFHKVWTETKQTKGWMNVVSFINPSDDEIQNVMSKGADAVDIISYSEKINLPKDILQTIPVFFNIESGEWQILKQYLTENIKDKKLLMGGIQLLDFFVDKEVLNENNLVEVSTFFKDSAYFKPLIIPAFEQITSSSSVDELTLGLSRALELVDTLTEKGLDSTTVLKQIGFEIGIGGDYFRAIAKLRALRFLWWQIGKLYNQNLNLTDVFVKAFPKPEESLEKEPYKNMLANTTKAMAAIIGGCDALEVSATEIKILSEDYREKSDYYNELSGRIARNVSVILKEESYFDAITDPGSGSYLIESLTHQIIKAVWERLGKV